MSRNEAIKWAEENGVDPGANFIMDVHLVKVGGKDIPNYDNSKFDDPLPLTEVLDVANGKEDEVLSDICGKCYSLEEFHDPKYYKSWDEMQLRLDRVLAPAKKPNGSGIKQKTLSDKLKEADDEMDVNDDLPFDPDEVEMEEFEKLLKS